MFFQGRLEIAERFFLEEKRIFIPTYAVVNARKKLDVNSTLEFVFVF
jgi:hypothetical protein